MMKSHGVLMFGWEFPPYNSGGLGVACEGLSKALAASGVHVNFVLPFKVPVKAPWCNFYFANETTTFTNAKELLSYTAGYTSHSGAIDKNSSVLSSGFVGNSLMERVKMYALRAPSIARKVTHTLIHAHDWLTYPAGIAAKRESGKPLIVHMHATEFDRSGSDDVNTEVYTIEYEGMHKADAIVAVSERTKKKVVEKYGIDPKKVKVVYNGVEYNENNIEPNFDFEELKKDGNSIVLFVGRITLQKGPDYFVSMAARVLEFEPKTYFVVSGSGDMEQKMIEQVARRGLSDRFIFCGFMRGDDLNRLYRAADLFVMPSVSEPFGIVPLEALLSDTPVLISKESGVSEILSSALKSHFWDIDDMADKVVAVLRHRNLKKNLKESGRQEVKGIHWKKAADSLVSLYNSL